MKEYKITAKIELTKLGFFTAETEEEAKKDAEQSFVEGWQYNGSPLSVILKNLKIEEKK